MDKIKIAMAHRGAGVAPVFAALEGGYFREKGLDPELVFYHGHPNSLKAMIAGEAQFTNAVGAELLLANHRHRRRCRGAGFRDRAQRPAGCGAARHQNARRSAGQALGRDLAQ